MIRWARILWYVVTLRCEEAERVRALHAEGCAARHQRFAAWVHRTLCGSCRHARASFERLEDALGELRDGAEDPLPASSHSMGAAAKERLRGLERERTEKS